MKESHTKNSIIGMIPARSGSKRIKNKNIMPLNGHPLIAYTIAAAIKSGVFDKIIVSTEKETIAKIAKHYGAEIPFLRPKEYARDDSPDIQWIKYTLEELKKGCETYTYFSILRPTNPFRQANTIKRAWEIFEKDEKADTLRAIEKCSQHPGKMWRIENNRIKPILENPNKETTPWHSMPYQELPEIYIQNASLEISKTRNPLEKGKITGEEILPFVTIGYEGFDINLPEDWFLAEYLVDKGLATLPEI